MAQYDEYNFDDDDDDDEEEVFEKKIYIDDDDDDEGEDDEEDNEYEDRPEEYSNVKEEYGAEEREVLEEEDEEEEVSDYEEKPSQSTSRKRAPKKSFAEQPPAKKARKVSIDPNVKMRAETPNFYGMPTITEDLSKFNGIPTAQENLKKKQSKPTRFICPLCSKVCHIRQNFERHLLLHDDFLIVLQLYYGEEDPVCLMDRATTEWKIVESQYLKQEIEPEGETQWNQRNDVVYFKDKYYEYWAGKRMIYRQNALEAFTSMKKEEPTFSELKNAATELEIWKKVNEK